VTSPRRQVGVVGSIGDGDAFRVMTPLLTAQSSLEPGLDNSRSAGGVICTQLHATIAPSATNPPFHTDAPALRLALAVA